MFAQRQTSAEEVRAIGGSDILESVMSIIRFYLDKDATSKRLLQALCSRGADVVSAAEASMLA
jgi:hypothetical protein